MAEDKNLNFYVAGMEGDKEPKYYDGLKNALNDYLDAENDGKEIGFCLNGDHVAMCRFSEISNEHSVFFPEGTDMHQYLSKYASDEEKQIISEAQKMINDVIPEENVLIKAEKKLEMNQSRYRFDENGQNPQRLWHGKTVEEFNEYDTVRFMVESDLQLHNGNLSDSARKMLKENGYEYSNGEVKKLDNELFPEISLEESPNYKYFYAGEQDQEADVFQKEKGWHKIWVSKPQGMTFDTWVVYRDVEDLPQKLQEYVKGQEYVQKVGQAATTMDMASMSQEESYFHKREFADRTQSAELGKDMTYKGFAYVPGKSKPYVLYGESPEEIVKKLQSFNRTRPEDSQFKNCNIGQQNGDGKYAQYHKYEVSTGKDISSIYLSIPPMKKDEFNKVVGYLKENGARFNPTLKQWYVNPEYADLNKFTEYISAAQEPQKMPERIDPQHPEESYDIELQYCLQASDGSKIRFGTKDYDIELQYCVQFDNGKKLYLGTKELGKPINEITAGEAVAVIEKAVAAENIKRAGYNPTDSLVEKYQKFNDMTGKRNTVSDICNAFKTGEYADAPEVDAVVKEMGKMFQQQEAVKQAGMVIGG